MVPLGVQSCLVGLSLTGVSPGNFQSLCSLIGKTGVTMPASEGFREGHKVNCGLTFSAQCWAHRPCLAGRGLECQLWVGRALPVVTALPRDGGREALCFGLLVAQGGAVWASPRLIDCDIAP